MHIALCLYGQYRNFDLTYKKIFDTFLNKDQYITDIYLSTWEEDRCLEKHIIKNINKNIYIDVEKETSKVKKGLEIFNTLYPMLYKQRRVFELTKKSSTKYDLVILLRMDIEFLNEFNINEYKPNILYIGNGYHLPNNKHNLFWRNNIYKVEEFFDIYKLDSRAGFVPNTNYVQPICDQFFIGSPNIIDTYTEMIYLLDKVMLIYNDLSIYRKILQSFLYKIYSFLAIKLNINIDKYFLFPIYKKTSKLIGFYIPFWRPRIQGFYPTLFSYQCAFKQIKVKISSFKYLIPRTKAR